MSNKRNSEGYSDPTAYQAMDKIEKEDRLKRLKKVLQDICALSGYRIKGQITFEHIRSEKSYRV